MKQRKKRPVPPPPPAVIDDDVIQKMQDEEKPDIPQMASPMVDSLDPEYLRRHDLAQTLQRQVSEEGYVLLKNSGILPLSGENIRLNIFGRHATTFFEPDLCNRYGVTLNTNLLNFYSQYQTKDVGYTGSGWDHEKQEYIPQQRTATGMFGNIGYLDPEPFIGHEVRNQDGSLRVAPIPQPLLDEAKDFSDTAIVVIYRHGGEGADHEKGDERLSEGEAAMISFCTQHFAKVILILATNSVIDGDFLVENTDYEFYQYTYGGGVYSNNIGKEVLADYESRVELRYVDENGLPHPHVYSINAEKLGGIFYTCNNPGDNGAEALMKLLLGKRSPSGRLMDEIIYDYDDNPVSLSSGGLVFNRQSTGDERYIYGHNYVAYHEGVYLGYKYFETFRPDRVVFPFGYGLSYTSFHWDIGSLETKNNEHGELQFSVSVTITNTGNMPGKDVVQLYVTAPYRENSKYHVEKPLISLCSFEKTQELSPSESTTVSLIWNARDIACYSDTAECYVLEEGLYCFCVANDAKSAHCAPRAALCWILDEDMLFRCDEITGTPYRNLFTGNAADGYRYDACGTEKEHIVYIHRIDKNGVPTVAPDTYPKSSVIDAHTRETTQILDLETRGLSSYYEMDRTDVHFYPADIPIPTTNAVYRDETGKQKNFMLQDVFRFLNDNTSPDYHNVSALYEKTGIRVDAWDENTDNLVWDYFLNQLSVNEMLCRFYHCGFDIPSLKEYGIPQTYSADTPGQIGTNNKMKMFRTTRYCDTILACTFNKTLCREFGFALAREAAASGENGTSYFYAPGCNLHRSCLSGKNNNYFSEDAYLAGWICGYFLQGLENGGINGCLKHFACNDQEISREGLVVFANEQTLRENYFAAFEHAIKIGGGQGIMTSLGRVGTVNACGNSHLTVELLRKEWGFNGMVITDGYGVTSYMYGINVMLGANSGLLCFGNSGNFGECQDFMELYRYYLQYPGRTIAALRQFMKGSMHSLMQSHTFLDLYQNYDYYNSEDSSVSTDINWFEAQIGLGYTYSQAKELTYRGIKLLPGEHNPIAMMQNDNCKDRGGTIILNDYGLAEAELIAKPGHRLSIPVSIQKSYGMSSFAFTIRFDKQAFQFHELLLKDSILNPNDYSYTITETSFGININFQSTGDVCSIPCGKLFDLILLVRAQATAGIYPLQLLPMLDENGQYLPSFFDKQGHEMSFSLTSQSGKAMLHNGWSGVYQSVDTAEWWQQASPNDNADDLADLTLLSSQILVQ